MRCAPLSEGFEAAPLLYKHRRMPHVRREGERTVNKDQVSGKVKQAVGKVKQSVGETVGNEKLANQGVVDQAKGAAKETWATLKTLPKRCNSRTRTPQPTRRTRRGTRSVSRCKTPRRRSTRRSTNSRSVVQRDAPWLQSSLPVATLSLSKPSARGFFAFIRGSRFRLLAGASI